MDRRMDPRPNKHNIRFFHSPPPPTCLPFPLELSPTSPSYAFLSNWIAATEVHICSLLRVSESALLTTHPSQTTQYLAISAESLVKMSPRK